MSFELHHGDCLDVMEAMDPGSIDAIVTDPPYGLKFMGKRWDHGLPDIGVWLECLRVLRPGGYMMAFGGTRTYHRLTCSIEDAGFEIRDSILTPTYLAWCHGSGFPKSKGCLKPSWEPIVLARKPGKKVLPLGIDECRVGYGGLTPEEIHRQAGSPGMGARNPVLYAGGWSHGPSPVEFNPAGRWPPNLLLVHHPDCGESCDADCVVRTLGEQSGERKGSPEKWMRRGGRNGTSLNCAGDGSLRHVAEATGYGDTGTAARFYPQFRYCPKASRRDRNEGCEGMPLKASSVGDDRPSGNFTERLKKDYGSSTCGPAQNTHSCVKPTPLLEWLVRLACPGGGTVLDPFMGSGSTGKACMRAGRNFIGIERDAEWLPIARARIEHERDHGHIM